MTPEYDPPANDAMTYFRRCRCCGEIFEVETPGIYEYGTYPFATCAACREIDEPPE